MHQQICAPDGNFGSNWEYVAEAQIRNTHDTVPSDAASHVSLGGLYFDLTRIRYDMPIDKRRTSPSPRFRATKEEK